MRRLFVTMLMLLVCAGIALSDDITITSEVDRREVEFGDQIQLTVSIKRALQQDNSQVFNQNGFSFRFNSFNMSNMGMDDVDFKIENIPGFDIISRRSSQQSRSINGRGESVKQTILSLVPQSVGEHTIPAFSFKDKEGKEHSSEPIKIKVNKAKEEPDDESETVGTSSEAAGNKQPKQNSEAAKNNNVFNAILVLGVVLTLFVIVIIIFAYLLGPSASKSNREVILNSVDKGKGKDIIEDAEIVENETNSSSEAVRAEKTEKVEFQTISASLKAQYREINTEFYRKYFELFKKACCYRNKSLSKDMTYDELMGKCGEIAATDNIIQASSRMAHDIELVMYANAMPSRQLIAIESDIKEILNAL